MDSKYYTDITDSAPAAIKESMNKNPHVAQDNLRESNEVIASEAKSAICQLKEANVISDSIVNAVVSKLRERGVSLNERKIYRVPVGRWDNINGNRRRYTRKLWENVMNNQQSAWKGLCGLADHPSADNDPGSIKNSSIVWLGMELDDVEKIVYGIGTFVGVLGHMFQEIIDAGGRVGFSSSGFGEIMADGQTVNPDTYQIERLADVVLNPSQEVYGEISNEQKGLGNIEYQKQTAVVNESTASDNLKESVIMDENTTKRSGLSKAEEKAFRNYVKAFIEDSNSIKSPNDQLKELKSINEMFDEGIAPDLKAQLEEKIAAKQSELEALVEAAVTMKEELGVDSLEEITEGTKRVIEEGAELAKQVENYKAVVEGMTEKNKELSTKVTTLEESDKAGKAKIEELTKENTALNETIKNLSIKITVQEAEALENAGKLNESTAAKITELTAKLEESEKAIEESKNIKLKADEAAHVNELKLEEAIKENKTLSDELSKANLKLKVREERAEKDSMTRNATVVQVQEALDKANAEIENLKKTSEAQIAELNTKINQYREGNDKLEKANSVLESKVKTANSMLNNLSTANTALNESIKTIKETANAEKDTFIKNLNESITKINENGSYELKLDPNGTLTVNVTAPAEPAPEVIPAEAPVEDVYDEYEESSKKNLGQYISFRESLPIEKYWADQYSQFGEALIPFEHKIRDAKTLAEAQREFFKALPFISNKIQEARINPKFVRQERLEEAKLPVNQSKTPRQSMAEKFGLL